MRCALVPKGLLYAGAARNLRDEEFWYCKHTWGMEKTSGPDLVKAELLHTVTEQGNILHTAKRWKATWIDYILRRNSLQNVLLKEL